MSLRLVLSPPAPGAFNMALDEALMDSVREGAQPVLRFYRWEPACISFGRNQPAAGRYDREEIARRGLDVVRRPTGGRAVLHARELTYSVVLPERALGTLRQSYAAINQALVAGLQRLGVGAALQPPSGGRAAIPSTRPCFAQPAEGEVVVCGRKLVGSAQYRHRGVLLQHGSLLLADDQAALAALTVEYAAAARASASGPAAAPPEAPALALATLADHCHPLPSWDDLTAALAEGWTRTMGDPPRLAEPGSGELAAAALLARRHADLEWIWRR